MSGSTSTCLHLNPFWVLGVSPRSDKHAIIEKSEEAALSLDPSVCQKARSQLTTPRMRLSAEVRWLPGVAPGKATKLLQSLLDSPVETRKGGGLPDLAQANLRAAALELIDGSESAKSIAMFISSFAWGVEELSAEEIMRDINEDRAIANFPEIPNADAVEQELAQLRKEYRDAIKNALDSMPSSKLIEVMTLAVHNATDDGENHAPALLDELVDAYELETQGFLEKEYSNISVLIENIKKAAPKGASSINPLIDKLEQVATNWDKVAQPIQLSMKARGIVHIPSHNLAHELRSLGIDLYNEHDMLDHAHRMTDLLKELFAELPEVSERLEEDSNQIQALKNKESQREQENREWEREITFSAEVGLMFKDVLSIGPEGIAWKGKRFPLDSITRVRWGGVKHSVNGIPTGTDYTVAFGDNRNEESILIKREATYSGFIEKLWRAVCVRLMFDICRGLKDDNSYGFGDILVEDSAVTLTRHVFFGSNERVRLPWGKVRVWTADGCFVVGSADDKKVYSSASYINHANTHVLEHIVRSAFKKGVDSLSDFILK